MSFFKDKSVALIGPAPHILKTHQAAYLNTFDLIVRCNTTLPLIDKLKDCTTARCDVLYMNVMSDSALNSPELLNLKLLKVNPNFFTENKYDTELSRYKLKVKNIEPIDREFTDGIQKKIQTFPNTGFSALCEIMNDAPKFLYITGFTFFKGVSHYDGYISAKYIKMVTDKQGKIDVHNPQHQLDYFIEHYYNLPNLSVDTRLLDLIETEILETKNESSNTSTY